MKKLLFPLFMAASFALSGCQQIEKSEKIKKNLEKKEYSVEVVEKQEVEARISGITWNVEIKETLYATKEKEAIVAFFCANIDDASKFVEENIAVLSAVATFYGEDTKCGSHNNVAYVGTRTAVEDAGLTK